MSNLDESLVGQTINEYEVEGITRERGKDVYILKCIKCGHCTKTSTPPKDYKRCRKCSNHLIGKIVNGYEILDKFKDEKGKTRFRVKCIKCGKEYVYSRSPYVLKLSTCDRCKILSRIGNRYHRLEIIAFNEERTEKSRNSRGSKTYYDCLCDCGNITTVRQDSLEDGSVKSCGCLDMETKTKHGFHGTPMYNRLCRMKDRCYNPNKDNYDKYGGNGIIICDEWMDPETGAEAFCLWALSTGFREDLEIDRIDPYDIYCPDNCHWVTKKEQGRNKRASKPIEAFDKFTGDHIYFKCPIDALEYLGLEYSIHYRIYYNLRKYNHYETDRYEFWYYFGDLDPRPYNPIYLSNPIKFVIPNQPIIKHGTLPSPIRFVDKKESDK